MDLSRVSVYKLPLFCWFYYNFLPHSYHTFTTFFSNFKQFETLWNNLFQKKKKALKPSKYKVFKAFSQAGDERIELPPKVLETPIIPFDQSPIIGCVRKTHVLLYSFIDICQELNFANCRKKIKKEAIKREKKRLCIPIYYDKINWCMNQIGVYVHNMVERFYQLP